MDLTGGQFEETLRTMAEIARRVVQETMELSYRSVDAFGLDAEVPVSAQISAEERRDLLDLMRQASRVDLSTRATRQGALPQSEDAFAKMRVEELLRRWSENAGVAIVVVGEESSVNEWRVALDAPESTTVIVVDPCDGTSVMRAIRSQFSINLGLYRPMGDRTFLFLGSVSTTSTGETIAHDARDSGRASMQSPLGSWVTLDGVGTMGSVEPGTLATVAARGLARRELGPLFDTSSSFGLKEQIYGGSTHYDPPLTVYTTAGAPTMIGFPMGGVEYVYVPHDQTVWDAFPLAAALAAGGARYFLADSARECSVKDLLSCFDTLVAPGQPGSHPVPAGLLVRDGANPATTEIVLDKVHVMWKTRNAPHN